MSTKYIPLLTNDTTEDTTEDILPTSSLPKKQTNSSSKIRKHVYLLIVFMIIVLYIFSDELSSIFTDIISCNKDTSGICLKYDNNNTDEIMGNINGTDPIIPTIDTPITIKPLEKFITYLPHSGFHNQRIAFENAVFLAWSLNRTLILPPILLGKRIGYKEYDPLLQNLLRLKSDKSNLEQDCLKEHNDGKKSLESCIEFHKSYMLTTWNHLFDLSFIEKHIKIIYNHRVNISYIINDQLQINDDENDIIYDKFYPGNHAFFEYSIPPEKIEPISDGRILKYYILSDFKNQPQKLLVFNSLFGPGTIVRQSEMSDRFFHDIQISLLPKNEIMKNVVKSISDKMGGTFNYLSFHGRAGDGHYKVLADQRIAYVISNLKKDMPDFDNVNMSIFNNLTELERHELCFKNLTLDKKLTKFSRFTRIYLASDIQKSSPPLQVVFQTFPCTYMMSDFEQDLEPLKQLINNVDGENMFNFVLPLVDLMVGSNARKVYTMGRSTFASYMLRYHHILEKEHGYKRLKRFIKLVKN